VCSQTNDSTYQKYLLNNQNVPKRIYYGTDTRNILKTDITSILDGIIPVIWEHRFSEHLGMDGGLGLIMPYSIIDLFSKEADNFYGTSFFGYNPSFKNKKIGVSLQIEPKLFFSDNSLLIGNKGYSFLSAFYNLKGYDQLKISEIGLGWGITGELDKVSLQMIFSVFMVNQTAYSDYNDFKYIDFLTSVDGNTAKSLRASIRIQIGYNFDSRIKPLKTK
jgi:hypothetical protein